MLRQQYDSLVDTFARRVMDLTIPPFVGYDPARFVAGRWHLAVAALPAEERRLYADLHRENEDGELIDALGADLFYLDVADALTHLIKERMD